MSLFLFMITLYIIVSILCNKYEKQQSEIVKTVINEEEQLEEENIDEVMIVIAYSIVRAEPNENSEKINTCNKGDKVKVISKVSNNWYKIESGNNIGHIKVDNVKSTSEVFIDKDGTVIYSVNEDGTIECDGDINSSLINYAYNYWYMIPNNIREDFREQDWKIVITDKSLSDELNIGYTISGVTIPNEKTIMIFGSQSCIRYALVHEIGHYIDYRNNFISRDKDFKERCLNNGSKMLNYNDKYIQASFSEEEYFAELYRAYLLGDYKIKFMFSEDIKFVENVSNSM